jgi:membrane protein YqaA with SNARE-associated domain
MRDWYKKLNITAFSESNIKWSTWILFVFAFVDASFFPLPVSTSFLLLILFDSTRSFRYVIVTTLGTFAGAFAGYLVGSFVLANPNAGSSDFLQFLFNHVPGFTEGAYHRMQALFSGSGFWILFGASFTPIPFGLFSLAAGAFQINILSFIIATIVSQFLKFFLLAYIAIKVGPEIKMIFKVNLKPILIIASVCIAIAFLVTRAV